MSNEDTSFTSRVREIMREREWDEQDLADALGRKVSSVRVMLGKYSHPYRRPFYDSIVKKWADALGVPPEQLTGDK